MAERLWTATLAEEQLQAWLIPPRKIVPYAILERLTDIDFPAPDEAILIAVWEQGRIFGSDFELRWEKEDSVYHIWLVGDLQQPGYGTLNLPKSALEYSDFSSLATDTQPCYLWGPNEVRIAHSLEYRAMPEGGGRAQLFRRDFRSQDGTLVYYRFVDMKWEVSS